MDEDIVPPTKKFNNYDVSDEEKESEPEKQNGSPVRPSTPDSKISNPGQSSPYMPPPGRIARKI